MSFIELIIILIITLGITDKNKIKKLYRTLIKFPKLIIIKGNNIDNDIKRTFVILT